MRVIKKEITIGAPPAAVWKAWATNEGVRSFFAPDSDIEVAVGGKYEIFFNSTEPYGNKGSEGCRVLDFAEGQMLSVTWNAPPSIPALRTSGEFTNVRIELFPDQDRTKVQLSHVVEKEGADWDRYYDYFNRAWDVVLGRLKTLFVSGPIDWDH